MTKPILPRFLCAPELSRLARWLRLLGFDTSIANSGKLTDWARLCSMQNRILLTRVRKNVRLQNVKRFLVIESDIHTEQLKQVIKEMKPEDFKVFSRCIYCNRMVYTVEKARIIKRLPEKVKAREEHFTHCRKCGRIFWKGTHYDAMLKTLNETLSEITGKDFSRFVLTEFA